MNWASDALSRFCHEDQAATAVEYAVLLAAIILVCVAAIQGVGQSTNDLFELARDNMPD